MWLATVLRIYPAAALRVIHIDCSGTCHQLQLLMTSSEAVANSQAQACCLHQGSAPLLSSTGL